MRKLRKTAIVLTILAAIIWPASVRTANAGLTILPYVDEKTDCEVLMSNFEQMGGFSETTYDEETGTTTTSSMGGTKEQVLGCAIRTGRVTLSMIPYFISYITNFLLAIVGLICVLFIVIGGYYYIYGGLTDQKEKGKKTIYHALLGLSISVLAWVIVSIIVAAVTG